MQKTSGAPGPRSGTILFSLLTFILGAYIYSGVTAPAPVTTDFFPLRTPQAVAAPGQNAGATPEPSLSVSYGANVPEAIKTRIGGLLRSSVPRLNDQACAPGLGGPQIELQIGNTPKSLITAVEKARLKSGEGFIIKTGRQGNCLVIAVDGKATALTDFKAARGVGYGAYAVLQDMGFRFLHPLKPQGDALTLDLNRLEKISRTEEPRWDVRAVHLHTMHPLELTNVLNGWGLSGPGDKASWEQLLPYWSNYLEWMTAHKQNEVEWMLLWSPPAGDFNQSGERQARLQRVTAMAKAWGVDVGAVTPVRFVQQNGWTLLRNHAARKGKPGEEAQNIAEITGNINWLVRCGFTAIGGELGEGEFSSAPAANTLQELNAIADHLAAQKPAIPYRVKVHVSQKQFAKGYRDPGTGKDINFNYLPLYANSKVGVLPHTIQIYSLDDPAPTYENDNFLDMFRFIKMAATGAVENRRREVLFYPETAYWVSYDVDVPLFLPVYPYRRVHDLRLIARDENSGEMKRKNAHINGQVIFSSGWEWGYWFNDVITAEAAWNPRAEAPTSEAAFQQIVREVFRLDAANELPRLLMSIAENQHRLLVLGRTGGRPPVTIEKRNGMAYMVGVDSFDEIGMWTRENLPAPLKHAVPLTQPNKFRDEWAFKLSRLFYLNETKYNVEIKPLLRDMAATFLADARRMEAFAARAPKGLEFYMEEFRDGAHINSLRAAFVLNIYDARLAKSKNAKPEAMQTHYRSLDQVLNAGLGITAKRKNLIPLQPGHRKLITSWENAGVRNPTDYHFGYLWTAYNLFYWQREYNKLKFVGDENSFCYMNILKASELEGKAGSPTEYAEAVARMSDYFRGCATIPAAEPDLRRGW